MKKQQLKKSREKTARNKTKTITADYTEIGVICLFYYQKILIIFAFNGKMNELERVTDLNREKWQIMSFDKDCVLQTAEELNIDPHAVLLAYTRGVEDVYSVAEFFGIEQSEPADPFMFPDMERAVERIRKAVDDFESIAVYGDYDVDGVTATAVLYMYLESLGAKVSYYIPDRHSEGYGLSIDAIDKLHQCGINLIVTVDNGISAVEEAEYIKSLGMELVVTDHHLPGEVLPDAVAVVDPHRKDCLLEFKDYVGAGVAYKLICAMEGEINETTESYLDLVALGTVADVMPLVQENRSIVRQGVYNTAVSPRKGIGAIRKVAGVEDKIPTASELAFTVAPRINAVGRMGSAERGLKLLLCKDTEEADELAKEINEENTSRQQTEQEISALALKQIEETPGMKYDSVIVVNGEGWNDGVIGIVASRIVEKYGKPAIVIATSGDTAKGSGRSVEGFSLYDALSAVSYTLTHFGGHKLAAGLGIETCRIDEFRKAINDYAKDFDMPFMIQRIDYKLKLYSINETLLTIAETMEPCGAGNPQPVFGLYNMKIESITPIGSGKHIRLELSRAGNTVTALKFSTTAAEFPYEKGDVVDLAVGIKRNEYLGRVSVSIIIKNIRFHDINEDRILCEIRLFERYCRGEKLYKDDAFALLPDRELIASVYRFLRKRQKWHFDTEVLCARINEERYGAVCVSLKVLKDTGLITYENGVISVPETTGKVDLENAPDILKLKNYIEGVE